MKMFLRFALGEAIILTWLCASGPLAAISQDLGWGNTHAMWEEQALRSTIRINDFTVTAVRHPSGAVEATLASQVGAVVGRLDLKPADNSLLLRTRQAGEIGWFNSTEIAYTASNAPVLDWVNLQLYSWWKGVQEIRARPGQEKNLLSFDAAVSNQDFFYPGQADGLALRANEAAKSISTAELEFPNEYARSIRIPSGFATYLWEKSIRNLTDQTPREDAAAGPAASGDKLLGILIWQEDRQILSFSVGAFQLRKPGLFELHAEDLPLGYFPFQPTMLWANVQIRQLWKDESKELPSKAERVSSITAPDTVGCTGLQWLDNSSLRPCCDQHDLCYSANSMFTGAPCTAMSWFWPFCGESPSCTWSCQVCNIEVVSCFAINLVIHSPKKPPMIGIWWSWGSEPICHMSYPGYCPAECMWCV